MFVGPVPLPQTLSRTQQVNEDGMGRNYSIQADRSGNVQLNGTFTHSVMIYTRSLAP